MPRNSVTINVEFDLDDKEYDRLSHLIAVRRKELEDEFSDLVFKMIYGKTPEEVKEELWKDTENECNKVKVLL